MTQRRVTKGLNGPVESPTRWDRFKDRLSGTFSRNADTVVRKSMAGSNIGMALDFIGGASEETQKEALQWLRENGKYHNGMIKKMYNKALKEDGIWTELFVDAYQKSDEMEKTRLWSMMSEDLSTLFDRVEFCDIIDNELRNLSKLYVAVGQTDEKVDHTKCWESLKELFEGRGGNSVEIRKFALDILHASNYGLIEFWEGVLTYEENGDYNELKKHAIRLLLREENTGGEELLLENFDAVKENLTELMGEELNEHEAEGIMALMFRKMDSISQEEYNVIYMETILQMAVSDDEDVRRNMSTGLKRLNEKKDETAGRITHGLMINAKQMIDSNQVGFLAQAMNLAELLEFTGKTEQIKSLIDNRVCVHIKNKTERMFDSPDIEMNLSAANTLVILSGHKEARRLIREVAIPELKDIAEDEDSSDVNRLRAKKMADRLEKVISDE